VLFLGVYFLLPYINPIYLLVEEGSMGESFLAAFILVLHLLLFGNIFYRMFIWLRSPSAPLGSIPVPTSSQLKMVEPLESIVFILSAAILGFELWAGQGFWFLLWIAFPIVIPVYLLLTIGFIVAIRRAKKTSQQSEFSSLSEGSKKWLNAKLILLYVCLALFLVGPFLVFKLPY